MANDRRVGNLLVQMRAEIGGIKTDIKELETSFKGGFQNIQSSAASAFKTVGASIAGAFSVAAIVSFGRSVVNLGGQLQDLQDQTGISAQLLSGMKSTLEESGSSIEAFAKGIFTAQKNLGQINSETDQAAIAIKSLGLNLDELRNASPEKFLELLSEAMAKPENASRRAADGAALLGKQFQELGPVIQQMAGRFEELRAKGMSQEDIKRLDEFGDSWTKLGNSLQILTAGPLAKFVDQLRFISGQITDREVIVNALDTAADKALDVAKRLREAQAAREKNAIRTPAGDLEYNQLLDERNKLLEEMALLQAKLTPIQKAAPSTTPFKAIGDSTDAQRTKQLLAEFQKDIIAAIDDQQKLGIEAGKTILEVFREIDQAAMTPLAKTLDDINRQFDELIFKITAAGEATGQNFAPTVERLKTLRQQAGLRAEFNQPGQFNPFADVGGLAVDFDQQFAQLEIRLQRNSVLAHVFGKDFDQLRENFDATRGAMEQLIADGFDPLDPAFQQLKAQFDSLKTSIGDRTEWDTVMGGMRSAIDETLIGIYRNTGNWGDLWINLLRNIALGAADAFSKNLTAQLFGGTGAKAGSGLLAGLFSGGFGGRPSGVEGPLLESGGFFSSVSGSIGSFFGFAEGGIVPGRIGAPMLAMVHGGETITPPTKGENFGGTTVVYNIDARFAQKGFAAEIRREMDMREKRTIRESVSAVREERRSSNNFAKVFGG